MYPEFLINSARSTAFKYESDLIILIYQELKSYQTSYVEYWKGS